MMYDQLPLIVLKSVWEPPQGFPDLSRAKEISIDLETCDPLLQTAGPGTRRGDGFIAGVSLATEDGFNSYYPIRHQGGGNLDEGMVLRYLKDQLSGDQPKIGANLLYDVEWLDTYGIKVGGPLCDIQVAEALLDEESVAGYSLDALSLKYLGSGKDEALLREAASAYGVDAKSGMWKLPARFVGPYAEADSLKTLHIWSQQKLLLSENGLNSIFDMESRLLRLLLAMRKKGVRVDEEKANNLGKTWQSLEDEHLRAIKKIAGHDIDPWSGPSIARCCDRLGIRYPRTDKGNPSITGAFLDRAEHDFLKILGRIRTVNRLRKVYTQDLIKYAVKGRIHCQFHSLRKDDSGTRTGRFSSANPNLQQIPSRDKEMAPLIRSLFIPDEGGQWCKLDYSQQEYRVLVHYAALQKLPKARECADLFRRSPDVDFHQVVADMIGTSRSVAKNINFGICIAKGQRVLTQLGLVPIEDIRDCHLLWDGIEWVKHEGVISKGKKKVITYEGLTATPDHEVWTHEEGKIPLRQAASKICSLVRSGDETMATGIAHLESHFKDCEKRRRAQEGGRFVQDLRSHQELLCGQPPVKKDHKVFLYWCNKILQSVFTHTWWEIRCYGAEVQERYTCLKQALQRSWDQGLLPVERRIYPMGIEEVPQHGLQGIGLRQDRQRWRLLQEQSSSCNQVGESVEQETEVFDILNAGPRRRFTCENVLVSNCYGMGKVKLAHDLGMSVEDAEVIMKQHSDNAPFIRELSYHCSRVAKNRGWIKTLGGRHRHFNLYEPIDREMAGGDWGECYSFDVAKKRWPNHPLKRAGTHKALNALIQGSSADMTKVAMLRMFEERQVVPHLTVHDELDDTIYDPETAAYMKNTMENVFQLQVPILADMKLGKSWGEAS